MQRTVNAWCATAAWRKDSQALFYPPTSNPGIFASNLMLGSDLRKVSNTTLAIISNPEALAVNRDKLAAHGRLVWDSAFDPPQPHHGGRLIDVAGSGHGITVDAPPATGIKCKSGAFPAGGVNCFILDSRRVLAPAPKVLGPKHISNPDFAPF